MLPLAVPIDANELKKLIEAELASVRDQRVVELVRSLLVEPQIVMRGWDYGNLGEQYPCWTVLNDRAGSNTGIAFCEFGFGPRCPWGLVFLSDADGAPTSMGMDSGWFPTFLEAFFDSMASIPLPGWRVFRTSMENWEPDVPVSEELGWEAAWKRCEELRAQNPSSRYVVHHPVGDGAS